MIHRVVALILVGQLGVLSEPIYVYASDGPEPVVQPKRVLTMGGRPIGEIRATTTDRPDDTLQLAGMAPAEQTRPSSGLGVAVLTGPMMLQATNRRGHIA